MPVTSSARCGHPKAPETDENNLGQLRFATGLQICSGKAFCRETVKGGDSSKQVKRNKVLAVEAVLGEPVSVREISLFSGKIQGISAD
jgi:hypothetical protein